MRGSARIRVSKTVIASILALTVVSLLAACGASSAKGSSTSSGATGAAGCASNFEFGFDHTDVIAGHTRDVFLVLNDGTGPCTIKGYPVVTVNDPAITVTPTTSADTWSNIAIQPVTFAPEDSATFTPNDLDYFALQGRDDTTNCKLVSPSIALAQGVPGTPTSVITVCGGELFVSPLVSGYATFNP